MSAAPASGGFKLKLKLGAPTPASTTSQYSTSDQQQHVVPITLPPIPVNEQPHATSQSYLPPVAQSRNQAVKRGTDEPSLGYEAIDQERGVSAHKYRTLKRKLIETIEVRNLSSLIFHSKLTRLFCIRIEMRRI